MSNPTIAPVNLNDQIYGEDAYFGRLWGGAQCYYASVTASGAVGAAGNRVLYGVVCTASGTLAALYDNTVASGQVLLPSKAMTAGDILTFGGLGIKALNGLFASWTSGAFIVLYL